MLDVAVDVLVPDADTQPIEVTTNHPLSPATTGTMARDFRGGPAGAGRRRRTGRHSAEATAARGHLVKTPGVPPSPPRPVVNRIHAWLAVALVAAVVVLLAVASDAATAPPPGFSERPVVTTVVTLPVPSDPRATEAPHHRTGTACCHGERARAPDRSPMPPGGIVDLPITSNGHRVRHDREMRSPHLLRPNI